MKDRDEIKDRNEKNEPPVPRVAPSRFMMFLYWLVRVDPDIIADCPMIDRFQAISRAVLLGAVAGIALIAWGGFFWEFWGVGATPLALLVVVWIVIVDQSIGATHWKLEGVLAAPKARAFAFNGALLLRLAIGGVTATATSYGATMFICHDTIAAQEQSDRDAENAAKRTAGTAEKTQLRQTMLGGLDADVTQAAADVKAAQDELDAARKLRDAADQQMLDNKIAADCQLTGGPGCRKGIGPQYRAARARQDKAADDRRQADAEIPVLEDRLGAARSKQNDAAAAFHAREVEFLAAAQAIDARVAAEAVPERNDPTMSYMALQKVFASPSGEGARFFAHLMLALLLTVELSYILVSDYFGHASVYMARLIERTKILGAMAAARYRRAVIALSQDHEDTKNHEETKKRPTFRVIPRFPPDEHDEEK